MTASSSRVISVLTAAAVLSVAGVLSFSGHGASAQPTATKPAQPTQPTKPAPPPPAKPDDKTPPPPPPGGERGPGERGPGGPGGGSVEGAMKGMNRAAKQLQGQIGDVKKKDENLKLIGAMQRGCLSAKELPLPQDVLDKAKDDAAKAKLPEEFRKHLVTLMRKLLDLEMFVLEGKTDAANAKLLEITKFRDESHEFFGLKE